MNRNNDAGLPYSDELYHYGIVGQKWGVRRFQNADRTWTAAGKERYGSGKAKEVGEKVANEAKKIARAVGNASKRATKHVVKRFKMKHPSLMSDEELVELKKRLDLERTVKDAKRDLKINSLGHKFIESVGDISKSAAKEFAVNAARNAAEKFVKTKQERKLEKKENKLRSQAYKRTADLANDFDKIAENDAYMEKSLKELYDIQTKQKALNPSSPKYGKEYKKLADRKDAIVEKRKEIKKDTDSRKKGLQNKQEAINSYYKWAKDNGGGKKGK